MNSTLSDSSVLISLARFRHFPLVTILEITILFGKKIALLTPFGVVMFQIFINFPLLTPPRGSNVVRTKDCLSHPLEVAVLFGQKDCLTHPP